MDIINMKFKDYVFTFLKGIILGLISMGIPGLSASTVAIIIGFYFLLVEAIANIFKNRRNLFFMIAYILGYMIGSVLAAFTVNILFNKFPLVTTLIVLGMIFGSLPDMIIKLKPGLKRPSCWIVVVMTFIILIAFNFYFIKADPIEFPKNPSISFLIKMFIIGLITSATFIVPGVDFALVFLALGIYYAFTNLLTELITINGTYLSRFIPNIRILGVYSLGYFIGLFLFSKLIKKLIYNFGNETNYGSFGFVIAAPIIVIKGCIVDNQNFYFSKAQLIVGILSSFISFAIIFYLGVRSRYKQKMYELKKEQVILTMNSDND